MGEIKIRVPPSALSNSTSESKPGKYRALFSSLQPSTPLFQKLVAEVMSTFIMMFLGCGSVMVNTISDVKIQQVGISLVFGLVVAAMVYSVGHISGCHMNPAVTLAFAVAKQFPWIQSGFALMLEDSPFYEVPLYIAAQCGGSIFASFMLRWILQPAAFMGASLPSGSNLQSFFLEIILTFVLMFVVAAVSTDTRAIGDLAGIVVGSTVASLALFAGPISGASMNPARSLGPAVASGNYRAIWVYLTAPFIGSVTGMLTYNCIRLPDTGAVDKPARSFRR